MFIAQVPIRFHAQRAAVFMPEPPGHGRNIHATLDANGREKVSKIVMSDSLHSDLRRRVRHASFEDAFSLDEWMGANEECTIPGG